MAGAPLGPDGRVANKALLPEEIRRLLRQGRPSISFFEGRGDAKDQLVWDALHGFRPTPRPDGHTLSFQNVSKATTRCVFPRSVT